MYSVEELQRIINAEIRNRSEELKELNPVGLYAPINYSLEIGGKRLRPVLLLLSYNLFSGDIKNALPSAVAIEVFHNFTLLHDDIMDKAEVRRNQPTVHKKFNKNSAILSGDAMAFLHYDEVNTEPVTVWVGLSYVSLEQARANTETPPEGLFSWVEVVGYGLTRFCKRLR